VTKHFLSAPIARLKLVEITPGVIERFLQAKATTHGPQTLNHLRRYVLTAFNCARRAERYMGPNPAKDVLRRTVPKRKPDFLRVDEVPRVLAALEDRWRPLFAAAIYTGLRKGELLGLTKTKVDLRERLLYVVRSYDRLTNKSKREEVIPIATELIPFLEIAIQASPCELVFPAPDGSMMREAVDIENVLRRSLEREGIVLGYEHVCRRKGWGHSARHADPEFRLCPTCGMKLWPKALVRKIRFHDLRHTTASLLLMAGANPAAVQRILRHSDPRIRPKSTATSSLTTCARRSIACTSGSRRRRNRPAIRRLQQAFPQGLLHLCYSASRSAPPTRKVGQVPRMISGS